MMVWIDRFAGTVWIPVTPPRAIVKLRIDDATNGLPIDTPAPPVCTLNNAVASRMNTNEYVYSAIDWHGFGFSMSRVPLFTWIPLPNPASPVLLYMLKPP